MSDLEETYPLTPMQEGMLFHALAEPGSGIDVEQLVCGLPEALDPGAFRAAWENLAARHAVLRTSFRWEGTERPAQEVHRQVSVPWEWHDWRRVPEGERIRLFEKFLREDRTRGFDPAVAPLFRVTAFQLGDADHRVVWTFHHALFDGRCHAQLLQELLMFYEANRRGGTVTLPPPPSFRDYVCWLEGHDGHRDEDYWRGRLKGFATPTPLVVDGLSTQQNTGPFRQGEVEIHLPGTETAAIRDFARECDVTMNTLVQGAWAVLWSRYGGVPDVVFGATRAGRKGTVTGADATIGLFINTLPVRVKADPDARVVPWLQELRAQWLAMRDHERAPLVRVQSWSEVPRGTPLFSTLVVFENYDLEARLRSQGGPWLYRTFRLHEQTNYPLTLAAYDGINLRLRLQFDRARFDEPTVARILGHVRTVLTALPQHAAGTLAALPILATAERRQLLTGWKAPAHLADSRLTIPQWFENQAAKTPASMAVASNGDSLTYAELNSRANRLAHHLRHLGVGPETLVALCLDRSPGLVVGMLAILKAGGAYVPLDPASPRDRLAFMLEDSDPCVLVTQGSLLNTLPPTRVPVVCIDDPRDVTVVRSRPDSNPCPNINPRNLAYVIYTSGSTGRPKGTLVTHQNVVRLFRATGPWFRFDENDVWTLFHSAAFDFSVWETWGALLYGGRLVIVPYLVSRSPDAFLELVNRERVTVLNQTPSAFRQLMAAEESAPRARPLALRLVIFGGEALDPASLKPWIDRHGDDRPELVNMYGITETTVHVTYRPLKREDLRRRSVIGVPIPDLQVYVLDERREPVPIGVPGEIYVGGAGVARGYLRRPELTAARFIASPFEPDGILYRTGDVGRFLPDHDIEYLGRADDQVKIRGFRVELGEIEATLLRHPGVRAACVIARTDDPAAGPRLVAYAVPARPAPEATEIHAHLRARLPDYMVPSALVLLDSLPLTINGKVDRRALPSPAPARPELAATFVAPRTAAERTLAGIWKDVLHVDRVGVNDNFFELGGNSLLLVQLLGRVRAALRADLQIADLFQRPTIRALTAHWRQESASGRPDRGVRRGQRQAAALAGRRRTFQESPT